MGAENDTVSTHPGKNTTTDSTRFELVGFKNFVRSNPKSDLFKVNRFHHIEFWCTDATNVCRRFSWGLGMRLVGKSDLSTGNLSHASYLLSSGHLNFLFTAPYSPSISAGESSAGAAIPTFDSAACRRFAINHGLGVRAIAIEVDDAEEAYRVSVENGAKGVAEPVSVEGRGRAGVVVAEVWLYGDVVFRYVSYKGDACGKVESGCPEDWFLPGFEAIEETASYPLVRVY